MLFTRGSGVTKRLVPCLPLAPCSPQQLLAATAPQASASNARPNVSSKIVIGSVVYSMDTVPFLAKLATAEHNRPRRMGVTLESLTVGRMRRPRFRRCNSTSPRRSS